MLLAPVLALMLTPMALCFGHGGSELKREWTESGAVEWRRLAGEMEMS